MEELAGRPAGQPASVKTFEKHAGVQKRKLIPDRPAGRPAGQRRFIYWLPIESSWHDYDR